MPIPWTTPALWGREIACVTDALESTWMSGGEYLERFESQFRRALHARFALAVSSGTTAIHLAYLGLDLRPGDEVIVPGFAFLAASNIALHLGVTPVFAEVDAQTWCLAAETLPQYLSPRTKAIVAVHTYGNVCDMDAIMAIADARGVPVVEDCAESLFSKYAGRYCGSWGRVSTFSFQATKTITTGEGGLVVTNSEELGERMVLYRSHGMDRAKRFYWHEVPGHNFRLTNIQAAVGVAQLEKIDVIVRERRRVYEDYRRYLGDVDGVTLQHMANDVEPVVWAVALKIGAKQFPQGRDTVIDQLKAKGIETRPGFVASSFLEIYESHSLPVSEDISRNVLSLPTFPTLKSEDVAFICDELLNLRG
jgi:perosamine synthetase